MNKLKRFFTNYEMTWFRLIIFSLLCGIYTAAVLQIPFIKDTALKEIGVGYECWFVLATFVIVNCKSYKEAAIKCFIFFLISQPLVYVLQSLVTHENLLKAYYKPWFIQTIFTIPGAMIAYRIKNGDYLSSIILTVAGGFIGMSGVTFAIRSFYGFNISYLFYGVVLLIVSFILGLIFIQNKKALIIYFILVLAISVTLGLYATRRERNTKYYEYELPNGNWQIENCRQNDMDIYIEDGVVKISYYSNNAKAELTITNNNSQTKLFEVSIIDKEVNIIEK